MRQQARWRDGDEMTRQRARRGQAPLGAQHVAISAALLALTFELAAGLGDAWPVVLDALHRQRPPCVPLAPPLRPPCAPLTALPSSSLHRQIRGGSAASARSPPHPLLFSLPCSLL